YDNSGYFHFNWGWGGTYDGYFSINALNPDGTGIGGGTGGSTAGTRPSLELKRRMTVEVEAAVGALNFMTSHFTATFTPPKVPLATALPSPSLLP
nr:hypothetical protein [Lentimicrobiaceae bacterium]